MLFNAEQVKLMFDEHAILFYDQEGVTFLDAIKLFGENAANFAWHYGERGVDILSFGDKETSVWEPFYSYQGFRLLATYANLLELRQRKIEAGLEVDPLPDVSLKPKTANRKPTTPKVIDIHQILKDNAAKQKVR